MPNIVTSFQDGKAGQYDEAGTFKPYTQDQLASLSGFQQQREAAGAAFNAENDAKYGAGNWYVGGPSGAVIVKNAPATTPPPSIFSVGGGSGQQAPAPAPAPAPAAPAGIVSGAQQPVQAKPVETAEGIVSRIMTGNSPVTQRARALAEQEMADRGLQSSSIAGEAGVRAAIDYALPIAQIDAGAQNARDNMVLQSQLGLNSDLTKMGVDQQYYLQRMTEGYNQDVAKMGLSFANDKALTQLRADLDTTSRQTLMQLETSLANSQTGKSQLVNVTSRYAAISQAIRVDPNLTTEDKELAMADLRYDWEQESKRISAIYGIAIPPEYMPS